MIKEYKSSLVSINNSEKNIHSLLSDFNNFSEIASDYVNEWSVADNKCNFSIQNTIKIELENVSNNFKDKIHLKGYSNYISDTDIYINLKPTNNENITDVDIELSASLPLFIDVLYSKKISKTLDSILEKFKEFAEKEKHKSITDCLKK